MNKAIVLLSGGLDSAVTLYIAKQDFDCHALVFDYGQKARKEIGAAQKTASAAEIPCTVLDIDMPWKGSALLDESMEVPEGGASSGEAIPDTYVPARNIIFLSYAVSFAEAIGAKAVFIGAHQMDYSNYPDCRGEFFDSFREMIERGTKSGVEGRAIEIITPIIDYTKKEIIKKGIDLNVPFEFTWSCYQNGDFPCGKCESCLFRAKAFQELGMEDPINTV